MRAQLSAAGVWATLGLALLPQLTLVAADDPAEQEQRVNELLQNGLNQVLSRTIEEVEKRAKAGGKGAPTLLQDESKPRLGYYVYRDREHRSSYYDGKMVRIDVVGPKGVKDVLTKLAKPAQGPKYEWMQVPDREAQERWHWTFQIIVEQTDGKTKVRQQVPWTYVCEFTLHKAGNVTVSFIDAERAETLHKALAGK